MDTYEKKYNEALERARQIKDGKDEWRYSDLAEITPALIEIFPELRESEDERIRKMCIAAVNIAASADGGLLHSEASECLAWLEKQKEHQKNCTKFLAKILKHSAEGFRNILKKKGIDYTPHESFWTNIAGSFSKQECNEFYKWMNDMTMELVTEETPEYKKGFKDGKDSEKQKELPFVKDVMLGYPGLYFYDGERMHFCGSPAMEEKQKEKKSSIVEKLREISTPADEDWFEIEKKWEAEDNENLRSFISVKFASNAKVIDGKRFAVFTWERFKDVALELINRGKEQKPAGWSEKHIADIFEKVGLAKIVREQGNDALANAVQSAMIELSKVGNAEWNEDYRKEDIQTRFAFYTYKDDPSILYLSNVFVEETSRNHGFGTRILKAAEKVAEAIGAITICLKVKQDSPANAWYRKRGYGYVAFEDGYDWLEKNLEYLKPTKLSEWSDEDEEMRLEAIRVLLSGCERYRQESGCLPGWHKVIDWLKSLSTKIK